MLFRSFLRHEHSYSTPVGNRYRAVYLTTQDTSGIHRKYIEEVDTYSVIQSYYDSCDVHKILARYQQSQDPTLLYRRAGVYTDVSGMPLNLSEAILATDRARAAYEALDPAVRDNLSFADLLSNPGKLADVVERLTMQAVTTPKEVNDNA